MAFASFATFRKPAREFGLSQAPWEVRGTRTVRFPPSPVRGGKKPPGPPLAIGHQSSAVTISSAPSATKAARELIARVEGRTT
jgi:hypothetical protein